MSDVVPIIILRYSPRKSYMNRHWWPAESAVWSVTGCYDKVDSWSLNKKTLVALEDSVTEMNVLGAIL